ncbi:MAG: LLM class flavin-dependent oxidoreductase [Actinomycetota bacterium]
MALATAATATQDVELGTATVQVPLYHPADLAHRVLSLMSVCGNRLTLGVSPGSTETDFATLDRDYTARFAAFHRNTGRLRVLLAHGRDEHADLTPAPAAGGRPAVLLGSWGANVERAARDFDGWLASGYRTRRIRSSPPTNATGPPAPAPASMTPSCSSDPVGQTRRRSGPCSRGNRRRPETGSAGTHGAVSRLAAGW